MKKILLFTVFLLGSVVITNDQIKFKVDANLSFSNWDINFLGANPKKIPGYRVNGVVEMLFAGKETTGLYYSSPGLSILGKGAKIKEQGITMDLEEGVMELTMRPHYLQISLQLE